MWASLREFGLPCKNFRDRDGDRVAVGGQAGDRVRRHSRAVHELPAEFAFEPADVAHERPVRDSAAGGGRVEGLVP